MPHTHTHCQEHIVQRDEGELPSSDMSLLSALYPLSQTPKIKRQRKKKQRTLPTKKSLFMRYYHSYRTKPWMWPSLMRTVKGQKNVETRVHNSYLNGLKKKNHCRSTFVFSLKARPPLCMLCRPPNIVNAFAQCFFFFFTIVHTVEQHVCNARYSICTSDTNTASTTVTRNKHFAQSPLRLSIHRLLVLGLLYLGGPQKQKEGRKLLYN